MVGTQSFEDVFGSLFGNGQGNITIVTQDPTSEEEIVLDDPVNHPSHYTSYKGIEVIQLTEQMNFNLGNAVKYVARADFKGKPIEDLRKAIWYIEREIARREGEDD